MTVGFVSGASLFSACGQLDRLFKWMDCSDG